MVKRKDCFPCAGRERLGNLHGHVGVITESPRTKRIMKTAVRGVSSGQCWECKSDMEALGWQEKTPSTEHSPTIIRNVTVQILTRDRIEIGLLAQDKKGELLQNHKSRVESYSYE